MSTLPELVILDRDGVINADSDDYIKSAQEWVPLPGSLEAITRLNRAGIAVAVASNQSGIGRGLFGIDALNEMHAKLQGSLARVGGHVDGIFFCPHTPEDGCECRKPAAGLLLQIAQRFHIALDQVPVIGDSKRDADAALAVGAQAIMVKSGKGERNFRRYPALHSLPWFDDLAAAVAYLLEERPVP